MDADLRGGAACIKTTGGLAAAIDADADAWAIDIDFAGAISHALACLAVLPAWTGQGGTGIIDTAIRKTDATAFAAIGLASIGRALAVDAALTLWALDASTSISGTLSILTDLACGTKDASTARDTSAIAADLACGTVDAHTAISDTAAILAALSLRAGIGGGTGGEDALALNTKGVVGAIGIKDALRGGEALSEKAALTGIWAGDLCARIVDTAALLGVTDATVFAGIHLIAAIHHTIPIAADLAAGALDVRTRVGNTSAIDTTLIVGALDVGAGCNADPIGGAAVLACCAGGCIGSFAGIFDAVSSLAKLVGSATTGALGITSRIIAKIIAADLGVGAIAIDLAALSGDALSCEAGIGGARTIHAAARVSDTKAIGADATVFAGGGLVVTGIGYTDGLEGGGGIADLTRRASALARDGGTRPAIAARSGDTRDPYAAFDALSIGGAASGIGGTSLRGAWIRLAGGIFTKLCGIRALRRLVCTTGRLADAEGWAGKADQIGGAFVVDLTFLSSGGGKALGDTDRGRPVVADLDGKAHGVIEIARLGSP